MSGKGYYWHAGRGKWLARFIHEGKMHYFGYHEEEADAAKAAVEGRRQLGVNVRPSTDQNRAALAAWFIGRGQLTRDGDLNELIKEPA